MQEKKRSIVAARQLLFFDFKMYCIQQMQVGRCRCFLCVCNRKKDHEMRKLYVNMGHNDGNIFVKEISYRVQNVIEV